jgi:hypothetical protein
LVPESQVSLDGAYIIIDVCSEQPSHILNPNSVGFHLTLNDARRASAVLHAIWPGSKQVDRKMLQYDARRNVDAFYESRSATIYNNDIQQRGGSACKICRVGALATAFQYSRSTEKTLASILRLTASSRGNHLLSLPHCCL